MARKFYQVIFLALAGAYISSCTEPAPHSNPLDPASPKYNANAELSGVCRSLYDPGQKISNVSIILQPVKATMTKSQYITQSNIDGSFSFAPLPPDTYRVEFRKEGYASDTLFFRLLPHQRKTLTQPLDALPRLDSLKLATGHEVLSETRQERFILDIQLSVTDPDRNLDIETAECEVDSLQRVIPLNPNQDHSQWSQSISLDSLQISQFNALLGTPFSFKVKTNTNLKPRWLTFAPFFLVRFIQNNVEIISPKNNMQVNTRPIFKWRPPALSFPFTYRLEISRLLSLGEFETIRILDLTADSSYTHPSPLFKGKYFWTIFLIDNFGNWTRSKEEAFEVR